MYDNKIRLSPDVIQKANLIAQQWGLKNARAAVEAVFRRYSDDYLQGRLGTGGTGASGFLPPMPTSSRGESYGECEALMELDDLLGL